MMLKRGLALCLVLAFSAATYAQTEIINVSFSPNINGGTFSPGQVVNVDVLLSQSGTGSTTAKSLRYTQFDFNAAANSWIGSDGNVTLPQTHTASGGIDGWNFTTPTTTGCATAGNAACGAGHYLEDSLLGGPRPKIIAAAFTGLVASASQQIQLPASPGPVTVLKLAITMPNTPAQYTLNVVNASDTNADHGAEVRWGFGSGAADPLVKKRAQDGGITGGTATFTVSPPGVASLVYNQCIPPAIPQAGAYVAGNSLWRQTRNTIRLKFDAAVNPATLPTTAQLEINELLPGGAFGANLNNGSNFTFTFETGNTVLRVREANANVLLDNKWYAIRTLDPSTWAGVNAFKAEYFVNIGDQNGNGFTQNNDVLTINASATGPVQDQNRNDVNGDGFRTNADPLLANANGNSPLVAKPSGH